MMTMTTMIATACIVSGPFKGLQEPLILTTDTQANPLLLASLAGRVDGDANLLVTLIEVLDDLLGLLLNLGDGNLLLDDQGVHILEQLGELNHLLLNLDEGGVTILDSAESGAGSALTVALHEGLLEDLATSGVLDGGLNLGLGGVGANDAVLAGHLVLGALSELRLDLLVLLDGRLEAAVDTGDVGVVLCRLGLGVGLDDADAFCEAAVEAHGVGREGIELLVGGARCRAVGVIECSLLDVTELLEVLLDSVDAAVNVAALVQDGVGVAMAEGAGVVGKRLHLDVACGSRHVSALWTRDDSQSNIQSMKSYLRNQPAREGCCTHLHSRRYCHSRQQECCSLCRASRRDFGLRIYSGTSARGFGGDIERVVCDN